MTKSCKTQGAQDRKLVGNTDEGARIDSYSSPITRQTEDNASAIFSAFLFVLATIAVLGIGYALAGTVSIWILVAAFFVGIVVALTIRIAPQWNRIVILRLGKYNRTVGPGLYAMIPFIEQIALHADQRVMITGFSAEETLTNDLVPVNVDAVVFWMIWNPEKAAFEVEDYYDSVSLTAQTALRSAIGRQSITEVTASRAQLDQELKDAIEEKTSIWGISILFVEIRNIVIPKELQEAMSAEARAEREKDARVVLAEVEQDIASMLLDAAHVYHEDELAFKLRHMHLLTESMKESNGSVVVPSSYAEGFVKDAIDGSANR